MIPDQLLALIHQAAAEQWRELDLSGNNLTTLPPEIGSLTHLETLILGKVETWEWRWEGDRFKPVPTLSTNQLSELPPELVALNNLKTLYLSGNPLAVVPEVVFQLHTLESLSLVSTGLAELPEAITNLTHLKELDLSFNQLSVLPAAIGQLTNLSQLALSFNQLSVLPAAIANLANLTTLDLHSNQISQIPNSLETLSRLKRLDLRRNPLPISPEILGSADMHKDPGSVAEIFNYLRQLRSGEVRPLNEAKLLLVGQSSVGKTSLVQRLCHNQFDPHQPQTDGLSVTSWIIHVNSKDVRLNVWDFGGQEIYHATHQFFLTKRSLYLLVCNCCTSEEENRLDY